MTGVQDRAYAAVARAKRLGEIVPRPCDECGAKSAYGHHRWGYEGENATRLVWLCSLHHSTEHTDMRRAGCITGAELRAQRKTAGVIQSDLAAKMGLGRTRIPQIEAQAIVSPEIRGKYLDCLMALVRASGAVLDGQDAL